MCLSKSLGISRLLRQIQNTDELASKFAPSILQIELVFIPISTSPQLYKLISMDSIFFWLFQEIINFSVEDIDQNLSQHM